MNVLGGLSVLSSGVRMAKNLISSNGQRSGKAFSVEGAESPGVRLIGQRDGDGDGKLSLSELGAPKRIFERFDADGDGFLTVGELDEGMLQAAQASQTERAIARYMELHDSDHDSLISVSESGVEDEVFEVVDKNSDSLLNRGELTSAYRQQKMDLSV